jgi:hypothetical protein
MNAAYSESAIDLVETILAEKDELGYSDQFHTLLDLMLDESAQLYHVSNVQPKVTLDDAFPYDVRLMFGQAFSFFVEVLASDQVMFDRWRNSMREQFGTVEVEDDGRGKNGSGLRLVGSSAKQEAASVRAANDPSSGEESEEES